jgi:DNA-binding transcriptional LysR family regulator
MSTLDQMQIFTRVAELASFTQAAEALSLPKASVSNAVQLLEAKLGTRLLHRTTRKVQLTQDGQAFYERSKDLLVDMDELHTMFQQPGLQPLRGRVRLDMSIGFARSAVAPSLPKLLAEHPQLEVEISSTDRRVDLVREGFDCVLRVGNVSEPGLVARPLGHMRMVNCASPYYLKKHGIPKTLADLENHQLVHYVSTLGAKSAGFEYAQAGESAVRGKRNANGNGNGNGNGKGQDKNTPLAIDSRLPMQGAVTVNNSVAYVDVCLAGLGLIQVPAVGVRDLLAEGRLVSVLPQFVASPMPVTLLYANRRNLSKRVRVVMDWLALVTQQHLGADVLT